jgi:RNA-directed DNA polymerase
MLARHSADEDALWLIDLILASEYQMVYFPGDDLFAANRPRGLPIGNLTSQHWAGERRGGADFAGSEFQTKF